MVNAQEWLDKNYPKENRKNVKEIRVKKMKTSELAALLAGEEIWVSLVEEEKKLEGFLNLNDFTSLEELDCSSNLLTKLTISKCPNLRVLNCSDNLLTNLIIKHNHKLEELNISNNNFPEQDLSFLSHLENLKVLRIGNNKEIRVKDNTHNRFKGSLQTLSNLTQLEELDISNTNISDGLEYLSSSVKKICCENSLGDKNWTVKEVKEKLLYPFYVGRKRVILQLSSGTEDKISLAYDYQAWRKDNYELIISAWRKEAVKLEAELQMEREEAAKALEKAKEWRERQLKEVTKQKNREIQELKAKLEKLQSQQAQIQVSPK